MILVQSLMERLASIVKSGDFKAASSYQNDTKPENENEGPASPVILVNIQEFHRKVSVSDIDENIVISLGNSEEKNQVISELDEPLSESTPTSTQKDAAIPLESPLESHQREFQPFGLASIIELVRVIIALLDPKNKQHVDTMHRRVALDLVTVALEFGGSALSEWVSYGIAVEIKNKGKSKDKDAENDHEKMALIIKDFWTNDVCKYLFQLLQSLNTSSNSSPTSWTLAFTCLILKNITTLYHSFGKHLRLQIEWVIEFIMTKVDAGIVGFDVTSEHYDRKSFNENGKGILVGEAREMYLDFLMNVYSI